MLKVDYEWGLETNVSRQSVYINGGIQIVLTSTTKARS